MFFFLSGNLNLIILTRKLHFSFKSNDIYVRRPFMELVLDIEDFLGSRALILGTEQRAEIILVAGHGEC